MLSTAFRYAAQAHHLHNFNSFQSILISLILVSFEAWMYVHLYQRQIDTQQLIYFQHTWFHSFSWVFMRFQKHGFELYILRWMEVPNFITHAHMHWTNDIFSHYPLLTFITIDLYSIKDLFLIVAVIVHCYSVRFSTGCAIVPISTVHAENLLLCFLLNEFIWDSNWR